MRVKFWGTRGSLASPGPETARYGGNTSCVEVTGERRTVVVLDAGTGIRRLGDSLPLDLERVDLLLTHLHLDHIQGLGFFAPLFHPDMEVHIWGPSSTTLGLRTRLQRYLSPPLFPVLLRDLPCRLAMHETPFTEFSIGEFAVSSALICHPGPTVGYRITDKTGTVTYLPDHEPFLGQSKLPTHGEWVSGYSLARGADLLIHDAQYSDEEYEAKVGWGHSSMRQAIEYAQLAAVKRLLTFHHDPGHTDERIESLLREALSTADTVIKVTPAAEGDTYSTL